MTSIEKLSWIVAESDEEPEEATSEESDSNLPFPGAAAPFKKKSVASDLNWIVSRN